MERKITREVAPALGDVRAMGEGDTLWLNADAHERRDWGRYLDAAANAITRGADVRWIR